MEQNENTLSVLKIAPGQYPQQVEIDNDLKSLQQAVGGSIGASYPFADPVAIVYADDGKLMGLPLNRALWDEDGLMFYTFKQYNKKSTYTTYFYFFTKCYLKKVSVLLIYFFKFKYSKHPIKSINITLKTISAIGFNFIYYPRNCTPCIFLDNFKCRDIIFKYFPKLTNISESNPKFFRI